MLPAPHSLLPTPAQMGPLPPSPCVMWPGGSGHFWPPLFHQPLGGSCLPPPPLELLPLRLQFLPSIIISGARGRSREITMESIVNQQACRPGLKAGLAMLQARADTREIPPTQSLRLPTNPGFFQSTSPSLLLVLRPTSHVRAEAERQEGREDHHPGAFSHLFTCSFICSLLTHSTDVYRWSKDHVFHDRADVAVVGEREQGVLVLCASLPGEESEVWRGKVACPKSHCRSPDWPLPAHTGFKRSCALMAPFLLTPQESFLQPKVLKDKMRFAFGVTSAPFLSLPSSSFCPLQEPGDPIVPSS